MQMMSGIFENERKTPENFVENVVQKPHFFVCFSKKYDKISFLFCKQENFPFFVVIIENCNLIFIFLLFSMNY